MIGITERGDAALHHNWVDWVINDKPAILITKNPELLHTVLVNKVYPKNNNPNIIVHGTITGFGGSKLEPGVKSYKRMILGLVDIANLIGPSRTILRIDPIIPTSKGTSGQRKVCACLSLKKELLNHRGQCQHNCLYCYWKE